VLVIGIGAVGLSAIAGAKCLGAGRMFAAGTRPISVEVAKKYGATDIINYREGPIDEQVRELTDGAGVDSVIIAGGNLENTWKEAIGAAKAGGTVSNVNYLSGADNVLIPRVEWGCGMSNINIKNGLCPGGAVRMERLADLALYGRQDPELLVTHKFKGLEKIEDALLLMKDKPKDLIKPVVMLDID
uniref:zinc-binding dehydrogenase n=1 Tax=Methanobrevibacter sp. TaxID=66852 RepID=UPI003865D1A8